MAKFISYDMVQREVLLQSSALLKSTPLAEFEMMARENLSTYFNDVSFANMPISSIKLDELNGVQEACAVIEFPAQPETNSGNIQCAGISRIIVSDQGIIPFVVLFEMARETTLEHEKIHLCQYLFDSHYPLTRDEFLLMMKHDLETAIEILEKDNINVAQEFLIKAVSYKTWIELEAHYHTVPRGNSINFGEWARRSYLSSLPIETFNECACRPQWGNPFIHKAGDLFPSFCSELEGSVPWIMAGVKERLLESLHNMLFEEHEEFEMEMMFGPEEDDSW